MKADSIPCFECDSTYQTIYEDYVVIYGEGHQLLIKNLPQEHCQNCGDRTLSATSSREIERLIEAAKSRLEI